MTAETILTDKDLDRCTDFLNEVPYDVDYDLDHIHRACRNTEQAVLQSDQVQQWKLDATRWQYFIANYEDHGMVGYIDAQALIDAIDRELEQQP